MRASMRWILLLLAVAVAVAVAAAGQRPKRFVAFRKGSTFFYRLNYKVNMLPYTTMFAQASGFKVGWQLPEPQRTPGKLATKYRKPSKRIDPFDLSEGARLLYDSHGLDGQSCLMKSLCQTMDFVSKQDGVLAKILKLMAGSDGSSGGSGGSGGANGANNATSALDPLVCRNYANHCPLHLLGFPAAFAQH